MSTTTGCRIQFCGATCGVTGSMHLLHLDGILVLLDAGAFLGPGSRDRNSSALPFNPKDVSYIFLSHAHLDHVGRLPVLCQRGFEGEVIATRATREIACRILVDSLKIQQEEEDILFDEEDVKKVESLFATGVNETSGWEDDKGKIKTSFIASEHILGSVSILFEEPISLLYTGDLGGGTSSLHTVAKPPEGCDYLVVESTYGDRSLEKSPQDIAEKLKKSIEKTMERAGRLLIPTFSVDRAEEILYLLRELDVQEKVYLDTPMGIDILDIYSREKYHLSRVSEKFLACDVKEMEKIFRPKNFERVRSKKNSDALATSDEPSIILASSGMLEGGRIRSYLSYILPDEKNLVLFSGYQAEGTLGREILDGKKEVEVDGVPIKIEAEIDRLEGLSAHADRDALLQYIDGFKLLPSKVFVVHGEQPSAQSLAYAIQSKFRIRTIVPSLNDAYELSPCEVREHILVKNLSIEEAGLNFDNILGKKIALFLGGVLDTGNGYKLIKMQEVEEMVKDVRARELAWPGEAISKALEGVDLSEFSETLLQYFKSGYISKGLIRDLVDAAEEGTSEYRKTIEKKVKNDALLLDEHDLKRKGISLPNRLELSKRLEDLLKRSSLVSSQVLVSSLNKVFEEIK